MVSISPRRFLSNSQILLSLVVWFCVSEIGFEVLPGTFYVITPAKGISKEDVCCSNAIFIREYCVTIRVEKMLVFVTLIELTAAILIAFPNGLSVIRNTNFTVLKLQILEINRSSSIVCNLDLYSSRRERAIFIIVGGVELTFCLNMGAITKTKPNGRPN